MTFNDIMNRVLPAQDKSSSHRLVFLLTMIFLFSCKTSMQIMYTHQQSRPRK